MLFSIEVARRGHRADADQAGLWQGTAIVKTQSSTAPDARHGQAAKGTVDGQEAKKRRSSPRDRLLATNNNTTPP